MSEFSSENIQRAAEEVRGTNFGDFMFRDPGYMQRTSRRRTSTRRRTSRRNTSRRHTSRRMTSSRNTSRRMTSRRRTSRRRTSRRRTSRRNTSVRRRCYTTTQGNYVVERCFEGSNQSYYRATMR